VPYREFVAHGFFTESLSARRIDSRWERCLLFCAKILLNVPIMISAHLYGLDRISRVQRRRAGGVGSLPAIVMARHEYGARSVSTGDLGVPIPHKTALLGRQLCVAPINFAQTRKLIEQRTRAAINFRRMQS
jgi:hypothetical protein